MRKQGLRGHVSLEGLGRTGPLGVPGVLQAPPKNAYKRPQASKSAGTAENENGVMHNESGMKLLRT
eukprot:5647492-Alexandrium_andersonii.AAC.1